MKFHELTGIFLTYPLKSPKNPNQNQTYLLQISNLNWLNLWAPMQYCCPTKIYSLELVPRPWQEPVVDNSITCPKMTPSPQMLLAPQGPSASIVLNREHPAACRAFVRCWYRSSSCLHLYFPLFCDLYLFLALLLSLALWRQYIKKLLQHSYLLTLHSCFQSSMSPS